MIEAILGLVIFGIVVTLYIDYQADKRFKILAEHLDPLIARVAKIETDIEIPINKNISYIPKITSSKLLNIMSQSTYQALKDRGRPVRSISINDISVVSTTSLMVTFIIEILLVAELLKIDPYSQDAVEDIKNNTLRKLHNYDSN